MSDVVITGIGAVTGLGHSAEQNWEALLEGRSAVAPTQSFDASSLDCRASAEVAELQSALKPLVDRRMLRNMIRNDRLAALGAVHAVRDAGLEGQLEQAGLYLASAKEISEPGKVMDAVLLARDEDGSVDYQVMGAEGAADFYPLFYVEGLQAASLFYISKVLEMKGTNAYVSGAAEAGMSALGMGLRAIRRGEAEVVVVGGFDDATSWWNQSKYQDWGLLQHGQDQPHPFAAEGAGTVLGEGSVFLVLESSDHAAARGARVYAGLEAVSSRQDSARVFTPLADGDGLARAVRAALAGAGIDGEQIAAVVAEGTATADGDAREVQALSEALGAARPAVTAVKGAAGHTTAASGLLNVAVAALVLEAVTVPAIVGTAAEQAGEPELDLVLGSARPLPLSDDGPSGALALAQGFQGQSGAAVLRRAQTSRAAGTGAADQTADQGERSE